MGGPTRADRSDSTAHVASTRHTTPRMAAFQFPNRSCPMVSHVPTMTQPQHINPPTTDDQGHAPPPKSPSYQPLKPPTAKTRHAHFRSARKPRFRGVVPKRLKSLGFWRGCVSPSRGRGGRSGPLGRCLPLGRRLGLLRCPRRRVTGRGGNRRRRTRPRRSWRTRRTPP